MICSRGGGLQIGNDIVIAIRGICAIGAIVTLPSTNHPEAYAAEQNVFQKSRVAQVHLPQFSLQTTWCTLGAFVEDWRTGRHSRSLHLLFCAGYNVLAPATATRRENVE